MSEDALPPPPVAADADLRHFPDYPVAVQRLRDSDLAAVKDAELFRAAVLSWAAAWHQIPAGSLPDDDAALSQMLGYGRTDLRRWRALRRNGALRGWYRASDGRLYHPVVAEAVHKCIAKSRAGRRGAAARWGEGSDPSHPPTRPQVTPQLDPKSPPDLGATQGATSDPKPLEQNKPADATALPRREGKGREKKEDTPPTPLWGVIGLPDWMPRDAWLDWCRYRERLNRKGWTEKAAQLSIRTLETLRSEGSPPKAVIEQSIGNSWRGLFALPPEKRRQPQGRDDDDEPVRFAGGMPV